MAHTRGRRREKKLQKHQESAEAAATAGTAGTPAIPGDLDMDADFVPLDGASADPASISDPHQGFQDSYNQDHGGECVSRPNQAAFFGLLDRQELEYFKSAESTLAANALTSDERGPFVANVFDEARGRELKLATNQVCSKLVERLVQLADPAQTRTLVAAMGPHVASLSSHKFASHCVEALLRKAHESGDFSGVTSMARDAHDHVDAMLTDKYAAHVLRRLLAVLGGLELDEGRSRKSAKARKYTQLDVADETLVHTVPESYKSTLRDLVAKLKESWDVKTARRFAIDAVASPVVQTVIQVEARQLDAYDFAYAVLDDANFVEHCLSDAVGSHFLEACLDIMPRKRIIRFWQDRLHDRLAKVAVSGDLGNFVIRALLQALGGKKHHEITAELVPAVPALLEHQRWGVLSELVPLLDFADVEGIAQTVDPITTLASVSSNVQADFIAGLVRKSPTFVTRVWEAGPSLPLEEMARDPVRSHVVELILRSAPEASLPARRLLLNKLVPSAPALALNAYGSHVCDALWPATVGLKFVRERVATLFVDNEESLKRSVYGRQVWRNWQLDKYQHKRHDWWAIVKDMEDAVAVRVAPQQASSAAKTKPNFKAGSKPPFRKDRTAPEERALPPEKPIDRARRAALQASGQAKRRKVSG